MNASRLPNLCVERENDTDDESKPSIFPSAFSTVNTFTNNTGSIGDIYPQKNATFDYSHDNVVEQPNVVVDTENVKEEADSVSLFFNRMVYCTFAMCLLWTTSLQVSTIIASNYISVPLFSSVLTGCQQALDEVRQQQSLYESCIDRQSAICNAEYTIALEREQSSVATISQQNVAFSQSFTNAQLNCSNAIDQSKNLLSNWLSGGRGYTLPYIVTCDQACVARFEDWLGSTSTSETNDLYNQIIVFNSNSNSRINSLATYSNSLGVYNTQYVKNKTSNLRFSTVNLIHSLSVANLPTFTASFASLRSVEVNIGNCLTSSQTNQSCTYGTGLYSWYLNTKADVEGEYQHLLGLFSSLISDYSAFQSQVSVILASVVSFFNAVNTVINWILRTTSYFASAAAFCGHSDPDFCSFSLNDFSLVMPGIPSFPTVDVFPFPSDLFNMLQQMSSGITSTISAVGSEIGDAVEQWAEDLDIGLQNIDFTPNDYNPPKYAYSSSSSNSTSGASNNNSVNEVTSLQDEESQSFLSKVESLLFSSNLNSSTTSLTTLASAASSIQASTVSISQTLTSAFSTYWTSFEFGSLNMSSLMQQLLTLQGILFLFDYLYRGVQSAKLIARFWSRGAVRLPIIKIRGADANNSINQTLDRSGSYLKYFSYFLKALPFIWIQLLMIICFVIVVIWSISAVFVPEYYSYCHACVHRTTNSTFISQTMASAAINYAALDGNGKITANMLAYNGKSQSDCASYALQSRTTYLDLLSEMQQKNETYANSVSTANVIESSVNITMFDAMTTIACSDASVNLQSTCPKALQYSTTLKLSDTLGYASSSSYASYTTEYCDISNLLYNLNPVGHAASNSMTATMYGSKSPHNGAIMMTNSKAVFNCANLPECQVTCNGPDEEVLTIATKHCSCMLEWFWNGYMLQLVLAVLVFVLLNLSRVLICGGLAHVFWQYFTPPEFDIQLTCDMIGHVDLNHVKKEGLKEDKQPQNSKMYNEDVQKEIADTIKRQLRKFVLMGYVKISVGVVVNSLWIWAASAMATNVAYQSE